MDYVERDLGKGWLYMLSQKRRKEMEGWTKGVEQ